MCFLITTYVKKFSTHFIFSFGAVQVQLPCLVINITSLQTIRPKIDSTLDRGLCPDALNAPIFLRQCLCTMS